MIFISIVYGQHTLWKNRSVYSYKRYESSIHEKKKVDPEKKNDRIHAAYSQYKVEKDCSALSSVRTVSSVSHELSLLSREKKILILRIKFKLLLYKLQLVGVFVLRLLTFA